MYRYLGKKVSSGKPFAKHSEVTPTDQKFCTAELYTLLGERPEVGKSVMILV